MADILLVEPDKVLARTYKKALEGAGYKVDWQHGAESAILQVDKHRPKLIILELQLAEHNGVEFLHELRSYTDWQKIPVIVLSSIPPTEAGIAHQATQKLGIIKYCYKPQTSLEQMIEVVKEAI